ncbi:MAG: hypothetical protein PHR43_06380 [Dehalococcoidales bacterium]|nr:hypothetical protein [Dehalococcoidales bacterium]
MLKRIAACLALLITLTLFFPAVNAGCRPAGKEIAMTNPQRPSLDLTVPAVTETATFSMG